MIKKYIYIVLAIYAPFCFSQNDNYLAQFEKEIAEIVSKENYSNFLSRESYS